MTFFDELRALTAIVEEANRRHIMDPNLKPSADELRQRYLHHPPKDDQAVRYAAIRDKIFEAACFCVDRTPASTEQARALMKLDEAMFLFNAAIARNE